MPAVLQSQEARKVQTQGALLQSPRTANVAARSIVIFRETQRTASILLLKTIDYFRRPIEFTGILIIQLKEYGSVNNIVLHSH